MVFFAICLFEDAIYLTQIQSKYQKPFLIIIIYKNIMKAILNSYFSKEQILCQNKITLPVCSS